MCIFLNRFDARKQGAAAKKTCTFGHFTEDRANDIKTEKALIMMTSKWHEHPEPGDGAAQRADMMILSRYV